VELQNSGDNGSGAHFFELDGMRGVLACAVMLFHLGLNSFIFQITGGAVDGGRWELCVDFFFILSGYVLSRSFLKRRPSHSAYFINRLRRLAPAFLLTTAAAILIAPEPPSVLVIAANMLMIPSLFGLPSINFPAWSIPFELFFPFVGVFAQGKLNTLSQVRLRLILVVLGLAGSIAVLCLASGYDFRGVRAAAGLGFGMMLYYAGWHPKISGVISVAGFVAVLVVILLCGRLPLLALTFYPLVAWSIVAGTSARTIFSSFPFQAVGRWSYSIYLLHIPVITTASLMLGNGLTRGAFAKRRIIGVVLGLAGVMYRFIELPAMKFKNIVSLGL